MSQKRQAPTTDESAQRCAEATSRPMCAKCNGRTVIRRWRRKTSGSTGSTAQYALQSVPDDERWRMKRWDFVRTRRRKMTSEAMSDDDERRAEALARRRSIHSVPDDERWRMKRLDFVRTRRRKTSGSTGSTMQYRLRTRRRKMTGEAMRSHPPVTTLIRLHPNFSSTVAPCSGCRSAYCTLSANQTATAPGQLSSVGEL